LWVTSIGLQDEVGNQEEQIFLANNAGRLFRIL